MFLKLKISFKYVLKLNYEFFSLLFKILMLNFFCGAQPNGWSATHSKRIYYILTNSIKWNFEKKEISEKTAIFPHYIFIKIASHFE